MWHKYSTSHVGPKVAIKMEGEEGVTVFVLVVIKTGNNHAKPMCSIFPL